MTDADKSSDTARDYVLEDQVGYVLRRVTQRHLAIFSEVVPAITTTQFAVMARLAEGGAQSQNQLGRAAAMDGATIKGVVDRLVRQGFVATAPDEADRRRLTVALTDEGQRFFNAQIAAALEVSDKTLEPLSKAEQAQFLALLARLT
ncbi:MAG: MarR family transcriptional regulator [Pseudorhodobacter sp.]|nr:MarR family transcriptional regulator [Pseudorhodobacter sp.]